MEDDNVVSLEDARKARIGRINIVTSSLAITCETKAIVFEGYTIHNAWAKARMLLDNPAVRITCDDIILRRVNREPAATKHAQERVQGAIAETRTVQRKPKKRSLWSWLFDWIR